MYDIACSMLIIFNLEINNGIIIKIDIDNFKYVKLYDIMYSEFRAKIQISKIGEHLVLRMP